MAARDVEHALARARARVTVGGQRQIADADGIVPAPAASRSDRASLSETSGPDRSGGRPSRNASTRAVDDHARQLPIAASRPWGWPSRWAASHASRGASDSGRASTASGAPAGDGSSRAARNTSASFADDQLASPVSCGDVIPVRVVRIDEDHRVVRRAAAERPRARIVDAVDARSVVASRRTSDRAAARASSA